MTQLAFVVLAAGLGKRLKSQIPKVLHPAAGRPLIAHVLAAAEPLEPSRLIVVVGNGKEQVIEVVSRLAPQAEFVEQTELLGTGDALRRCAAALSDFDGQVVVVSGDSPLITTYSLKALVETHGRSPKSAAVLTALLDDPTGYGRIVRSGDRAISIIEEADATGDEKKIKEVSVGFWCFDRQGIFEALDQIGTDNAQGEFYLPDAALVVARTEGMLTIPLDDPMEGAGVNDRMQLAHAATELRMRVIEKLAAAGVTIEDPATTYIEEGVEVGRETVIRPMTFLEGSTTIGEGSTIGPSARIVDSQVGDGCDVSFAVVRGSTLMAGATVGPFTSIRPGTTIGPDGKAGSFVEIKASSIGEGSKVPHLSYIGDAEIGDDVNVGAGTITCNYDGETKKKSKTVIADGARIGSDTMLVAPVTVGRDAVTGAGSVVTKDVEPGDVVIGAPARPVRKRRDRA